MALQPNLFLVQPGARNSLAPHTALSVRPAGVEFNGKLDTELSSHATTRLADTGLVGEGTCKAAQKDKKTEGCNDDLHFLEHLEREESPGFQPTDRITGHGLARDQAGNQ